MDGTPSLATIPDEQLLLQLRALLCRSRRTEADLVAHVGEVDARRLYACEACPSMFVYCTRVLHLSEHESYVRITAARAARRYPVRASMIADGRLHLSGIAKVAPHLTADNADDLLQRATDKSKREIVAMLAALFPQPEAPARIRRLPSRRPELGPDRAGGPAAAGSPAAWAPAVSGCAAVGPTVFGARTGFSSPTPVVPSQGGLASAAAPSSTIEPIAAVRYRVQFTAGAELREKLERLCELTKPSVPHGDLAAVIEVAVTEKLERLEARRFATTRTPRKSLAETDTSPASRYVPAPVRRAVHERDGGRCRYVDEQGRRCEARQHLEYHHRHPYAAGGPHSVDNVSLLCRTHNRMMAEIDFGLPGGGAGRSASGLGDRAFPPPGH